MARFSLSSARLWLLRCTLVIAGVLGLAGLVSVAQTRWPTYAVALEEALPDSGPPVIPQSPAQQRKVLVQKLGAERWHADGHRGAGVKIAILDSGFRGYRNFLGGILPASVTAKSFRNDGNLEARDSQHGILCAEVLHALAPEAELLFANWEPDRPEQFLAAVRWAKEQGARVISCSLIMPSWSDGEGGGAVNEALAGALGNGTGKADVLFFASAGNTAQRHWCGAARPDAGGNHQWRAGVTANELMPWGNERVSVELYGHFSGKGRLSVHDARTGKEVAGAAVGKARAAAVGASAIVRFQPEPNHRYEVRLRVQGGPVADANALFHVVALGAHLMYADAHGSIPCPADCRSVHAIGAVDGDGQRHVYSSCGPNSPLPKPDLVAEVPFPSLWRPRAFAGTSAAAPQAAALAALLWARHGDWTAAEVSAELRRAARDVSGAGTKTPAKGHDVETGYGCISLP
jgi:subtilisin family serine protease